MSKQPFERHLRQQHGCGIEDIAHRDDSGKRCGGRDGSPDESVGPPKRSTAGDGCSGLAAEFMINSSDSEDS